MAVTLMLIDKFHKYFKFLILKDWNILGLVAFKEVLLLSWKVLEFHFGTLYTIDDISGEQPTLSRMHGFIYK